DGYARNFLFPQKLAKLATEQALIWLKIQKEIQTKKIEQDLTLAQELASKLDGQEIEISVKTGEKDQLFEKITAQKIAEKLKELGFNISKSQIEVSSIDQIGEFPVKIKLEHNLEIEIKLIITEQT
ncbi:MAG: 50S ribosomal protein L9, partial [Candidatus Pacebacteria bacterium]|nr:50S ribosomal protein L9 [Candidatus Paceibacterota bacterium]